MTYKQRQHRAKQIRRDRRREEREMRKQMQEKEQEFKRMIRSMGMGDQVSSSESGAEEEASYSSGDMSDSINPFL